MHNFFIENRKSLYSLLKNNSIVILFSGKAPHKSNDVYYDFEVNRNFYYLTGIQRENTIFMAFKTNNKIQEFLFIEKNDPVLEKWIGKKITAEEATKMSGIENIFDDDYFRIKLNSIINLISNNIETIYFDLDKYAWDDANSIGLNFSNKIQSNYPFLKIENVYKFLVQLRSIKKTEEIELIKKSIDITKDGIELIIKHAIPGIKECELEAYFDFTLKSKGVKHAFSTIAASGKNATILHYVNNDRIINNNDLILFDLGASINNYCADISRTFPINGIFTQRQKTIYNIVLSCMKIVISNMKPGVSMRDINILAKKNLAQECKKIGLINSLDEIDKYYYHSIGHPLGLDTHDVGDRDIILKPGMIYTCEPGLYIEEESIGIRIEDDILITENGNINLSEHIIKEVEEIETFFEKLRA